MPSQCFEAGAHSEVPAALAKEGFEVVGAGTRTRLIPPGTFVEVESYVQRLG